MQKNLDINNNNSLDGRENGNKLENYSINRSVANMIYQENYHLLRIMSINNPNLFTI